MPSITNKPRTLALAAVVFIGLLSWWFISNKPDSGITIYDAKRIITMENDQPTATAVAVFQGKVLQLGDTNTLSATIKKAYPDELIVLDHQFSDKIIMPGFIENHLHPSMAALLLPFNWITPFEWQLPNKTVVAVKTEAAYQQALKAAASEHKSQDADSWFISWGYHHYFHGEMSREILDQLIPDQPAIVWHRSFHEIYVNSAALAMVDISEAELKDQLHVDIDKGHFYETGLGLALEKFRDQIIAPMKFLNGLEQVVNVVHSGGITTIGDMAMGMFDMDMEWLAMKWVLEDNDTPFRTRLIPMADRLGEKAGSKAAIANHDELLEKGSEQLKFVKQVKLLADGAFYSQLMQMRDPGYLDGHHGEWLTKPDVLEEIATGYWQADYQIHIHTNGDLGADVVLNLIEKLQQQWPRENHRTTLHHLGYIGPDQAQRIAELNVLVSANPYYLYTLGDKYAEMGLGPERAHWIFRGRDLLDNGVSLSLHSDFSMAPAQPLLLAWVAVNRISANGNVLAPDQKLTMHEAMRAITIDAAYAIGMESEVGSLKAGKWADFTVLEEDPYQIQAEALKDIPIWGTVFQGKPYPISH